MEPLYTVKNKVRRFGVTIHPETAIEWGVSHHQKMKVGFGVRSYQTTIRTSSDLSTREVWLGGKVLQWLMVPTFCRYEISVENNIVAIGPFIGILESRSGVEKAAQLVSQYDKIGGAIMAFTEGGIKRDKKVISGMVFNPDTRKWIRGTYAYPSSLFKKVPVSEETRKHLYMEIGKDRIFNTPVTGKWEMYMLLMSLPGIQAHLPNTIIFTHPKDIWEFLSKYGQVYIKPVVGMRGTGILKVSKNREGITVQYRENKRNCKLSFHNDAEANVFFTDKLTSGCYMVQQAINQINEENQIVDFRLTIVKNGAGIWEEIGFYARYAPSGSIISNVTEGGKILQGDAAIKHILRLTSSQTRRFKMSVSDIAMKVVQSIDECDGMHYGNLGFDIAVDTSRHIWILEVNRDPGFIHAIRSRAQLSNMLYAKRLAGIAGKKG